MIGLIDSADVYTADPTTSRYTVLAHAGLPCHLAHPRGAQSAHDRAELAKQRTLIWTGYDLSERAQLAVAGERWGIVAGTSATWRGPSGAEVYRTAIVVRAS